MFFRLALLGSLAAAWPVVGGAMLLDEIRIGSDRALRLSVEDQPVGDAAARETAAGAGRRIARFTAIGFGPQVVEWSREWIPPDQTRATRAFRVVLADCTDAGTLVVLYIAGPYVEVARLHRPGEKGAPPSAISQFLFHRDAGGGAVWEVISARLAGSEARGDLTLMIESIGLQSRKTMIPVRLSGGDVPRWAFDERLIGGRIHGEGSVPCSNPFATTKPSR